VRSLPKPAILILAAGLAIRLGTAVADSYRPFFPPYNYIDAQEFHNSALTIVRSWRGERDRLFGMGPGRELYTITVACLYRVFGPHPLLPALINGFIAMGTALFWYWLAASLFNGSTALVTLALLSFWPSHVFFTSQHLKESLFLFCIAAAILPPLLTWNAPPGQADQNPHPRFALGSVALILVSMLRVHLLPIIGIALLTGGVAAILTHRKDRERSRVCAIGCAWILVVLAAALPVTKAARKLISPTQVAPDAKFVPAVIVPEGVIEASIFTPEGLSERRYSMLKNARATAGRRIETQIYPDIRFKSWWDVARFFPRVAFHSLFMPLPGFYPLGGKLSRILASSENLVLLLLTVAAVMGAARGPRSPATLSLLVLFCLIAAPTALLEFDLGSAARHKLIFFPVLFPFAAWQISDILKRSKIQWLRID
jgi:4-amino-4-deoxy-L-arabinose transferase-like glycosyltransferase